MNKFCLFAAGVLLALLTTVATGGFRKQGQDAKVNPSEPIIKYEEVDTNPFNFENEYH